MSQPNHFARELAILDALIMLRANVDAAMATIATRREVASQAPRLEVAGAAMLNRLNGNNVPSQGSEQAAAVNALGQQVNQQLGNVMALSERLKSILKNEPPSEPKGLTLAE